MVNYRRIFWWALVIKTIQFVFLAYAFITHRPAGDVVNGIFVKSKDYGMYVLPSQNLVDHGSYYLVDNKTNETLYANKMPGMVPIYAPLYWMFGQAGALTLLVILQFLADVVSVCLLAWIVQQVFNVTFLTYLAALLYALNVYVSVFTHHALSELFSTVFIITSVFFLLKGMRAENERKMYTQFFFAGLFATWALCIRPASGILFPVAGGILLHHFLKHYRGQLMTLIKMGICFGAVFVVFESFWIVRNYRVMGALVPLDKTAENFMKSKPAYSALFPLIQSFGGDVQSWNPESAACWFVPPSEKSNYRKASAEGNPFPSWFLSETITMDRMKALRKDYYAYHDTSRTEEERQASLEKFRTEAKGIRATFKKEKPFYYHAVAPLYLVKDFLFIRRAYSLPFTSPSLTDTVFRLTCFAFYYVILLFGLAGIVLALFKGPGLARWLTLLPILHIAAYAIVLRYIENRYLVAVYPFLTVFAAYFIYRILNRFAWTSRLIKPG